MYSNVPEEILERRILSDEETIYCDEGETFLYDEEET